ncbi:MAG TPA: helix-turn-helix domain-containing protein [Amycolatopsis sp.]|jgi:excisionase family DNA binding protein|nr:helix-turn-helix domain-containing protein [Amycolatopsis sp.]
MQDHPTPSTPLHLSPPSGGLEPLLTVAELADYLGVPVATIYDWRVDGKGPRGIRIGRSVKFAVSDVRAWIDAHREPPASGEGR